MCRFDPCCICAAYSEYGGCACGVEMRACLIDRGGGITLAHTCARAQFGATPLICTALYGHADCVRLLLDAGANMNARDNVRRLILPPLGLGEATEIMSPLMLSFKSSPSCFIFVLPVIPCEFLFLF